MECNIKTNNPIFAFSKKIQILQFQDHSTIILKIN